jgi:shikimate dehydrogenase
MKCYGLIGYPLQHSFSQQFFSQKFEEEKIDARYDNYPCASIEEALSLLKNPPEPLFGVNVTIPYKEQIIPFLHSLSPMAQAAQAVNVIKMIQQGGRAVFCGYNTDVIGFQQSIKPLINPQIHHSALIFGTGGAAKAVAVAFQNMSVKYAFVSRKPEKSLFTYNNLTPEIIASNQILVNATPTGTFPHTDQLLPIPYETVGKNHLLFDLVYNPTVTPFLEKGKRQGAVCKNGLEMLHLQAIAAWKIWQKEEN